MIQRSRLSNIVSTLLGALIGYILSQINDNLYKNISQLIPYKWICIIALLIILTLTYFLLTKQSITSNGLLHKNTLNISDVEKFLNIDIIGTIPQTKLNSQDFEKIVCVDNQILTHDYIPTQIGEAFRALRTNLIFSKSKERIHSFLITGASRGVGSSFIAVNLAICLAQNMSNTLLIDGDLRRGVLHSLFNVIKEPGFTNYLTRTLPLETVLQETYIPNLSIISCGSLIPNPSEILGSHQMEIFLNEVRGKFDILIFDSPSLNITDATVIGTQVDATAIVIRAGIKDINKAKEKLDSVKNLPLKIVGVILNGLDKVDTGGYSYY